MRAAKFCGPHDRGFSASQLRVLSDRPGPRLLNDVQEFNTCRLISTVFSAQLCQENSCVRIRPRSLSAVAADGESKTDSNALRIASRSAGSNSLAASPTTSGNELELLQATGQSSDMASSTGMPNPS